MNHLFFPTYINARSISGVSMYNGKTQYFTKTCIGCNKEYTVSVSGYDYRRYLQGTNDTSYDYEVRREIDGCFCPDCITKGVVVNLVTGEKSYVNRG